jgi:hypothetical protein
MEEGPPTLEYQKPEDRRRQRADAKTRPVRRWGVLLCWVPSGVAVLVAGVITKWYGGVAEMPHRVYAMQQFLLGAAFWWAVIALLGRLIRRLIWSVRE